MYARIWTIASLFVAMSGLSGPVVAATSAPPPKGAEKIIIDTDIGDDIDDAFAIALALRSPELDILGISTAYGDTAGRATIVDRMLGETGRASIPVAVGIGTPIDPALAGFTMNQRRYGSGGHFGRSSHPQAVEFILEQIRRYPGEITLVTIGPLTNIGALIDRSPDTFRKLKRVVVMGGSFEAIKDDYGNAKPLEPMAEWNIRLDIGAAQKLFRSGVPLYVMPLDSTIHLLLDEVKRNAIFSHGTPNTDALTLLYHQWAGSVRVTPTLFDAMTIAYILNPELCPVQPMNVHVDDKGFTRVESGTPNAQVCLHSDSEAFFRFYMSKLLAR